MIIDRIGNAHLYYTLHARFKRAFDYVEQIDINNISIGRHEIDAESMYALVQEYDTKSKEQGKWEAHRRYVDLQYVVKGVEGVGYANVDQLHQGTYDAGRDFLPLEGTGDLITLQHGSFVLLLPEDAHMPGMSIGSPAPVKKIVVKISVE